VPSRSFRPCTHHHTSIHICCCSLVYLPDTSFHTTPHGLLPAEHSLLIRSPHIAHIVSSFRTQYIYPSPVLVKARQLWPPFLPFPFVCARQLWPFFLLLLQCPPTTHYALDKHLCAAAGITTHVHRSHLLSVRACFQVHSLGFILNLSSQTLVQTFHLQYIWLPQRGSEPF